MILLYTHYYWFELLLYWQYCSALINFFHKHNDKKKCMNGWPIDRRIRQWWKQPSHSSLQFLLGGNRYTTKESTRSSDRRTVPKLLQIIFINCTRTIVLFGQCICQTSMSSMEWKIVLNLIPSALMSLALCQYQSAGAWFQWISCHLFSK